MMKDKKFNQYFLLFNFICLLSIASLNFAIDPAGLYLKKILLNNEKKRVLGVLNETSFGVIFKGNERILASWFIEDRKNLDCVLIGSSHIMTISSFNSSYIKNNCHSFLNLGVSASSLEDFLIFTKLLKENSNYPNKIFIEIPHWFLKENMDTSYLIHKHHLEDKVFSNSFLDPQLLINLFSFEYTIESFEQMFKENKADKKEEENFLFSELKENPWIKVPDKAGKMADGSHFYDTEYAKKSTSKDYDLKPYYQYKKPAYEKKAVQILSERLSVLQQKSEIVLLLTPYHHSSFQDKYSDFSEFLKQVESFVLSFAQKRGYKVLGSYFPNKVGCRIDEFYDFMHPHNSCLEKMLNLER